MSSVTRIFAVGLTATEQRLFKGICAISQRRENKLEVLDISSANEADVLLVDEQSAEYKLHRSTIETLSEVKPMILIDSNDDSSSCLKRPVEWSRFPSSIAKILSEHAHPSANPQNPYQANSNLPTPKAKSADSIIPRILVVDDSVVVREQLKEILTNNNYEVTTAASGDEALSIFKADYYHKVLLDVVMPNVDGYEVCRKLRSIDKKTPIIMLTSKSSPFDKIRGKMAGCEAYLTKPVVMRYLLKKLI